MTHDDLAGDWAARAALARSMGDAPTADWCDEQAEYHLRHSDNARPETHG